MTENTVQLLFLYFYSLQVAPHSGWEVEETFVVVVYDVTSFPAEVGSAEMDPDAMTFTLTVSELIGQLSLT